MELGTPLLSPVGPAAARALLLWRGGEGGGLEALALPLDCTQALPMHPHPTPIPPTPTSTPSPTPTAEFRSKLC